MIRPLALIAGLAAGAAAQDATTDTPEPRAILAAALKAHGAGRGADKPITVWFRGSISRRTAEGDHQEFDVEQYYTRARDPKGTLKETIATRLAAKGLDDASITGFNGRFHFVVKGGKREIIDYKTAYKKDVQRVRDDLTRTRFVVDTFVAGRLLRPDATVVYVRAASGDGMQSHVIDHSVGGQRLRYYVNRKPGTPPYFLGIEFPATKTSPRQNLCFGIRTIHDFDGLRLPRELKVFLDSDKRADTSLWIRYFSLAPKKPDWLP